MTVLLDDAALCDAIRGGDERAFAQLVQRYHVPLLRLALTYVKNPATAEEVVQETWLGVVRGLDRFERRASLKTWIFRILSNTAKTRAARDRRVVPIPFAARDDDAADPVDADAFLADGRWASTVARWDELPETRLLSDETVALIEAAIASLPPAQRQVIVLRDVEGWAAEEVCELLGLSEANGRVLLHRARSKVRAALAHHLDGGPV